MSLIPEVSHSVNIVFCILKKYYVQIVCFNANMPLLWWAYDGVNAFICLMSKQVNYLSFFIAKLWRQNETNIKWATQPDKTNETTCAPSEASGQPCHPPSLIFPVCMKKPWVLSYLPIECTAKTLIRLSLCWVHKSFCWFFHAVAQMDMSKDGKVH